MNMTSTITLPALRKNGRPSKFTAETQTRVLSCVEKGLPLTLAASAAGISYQSLVTYRAKNPQFADALVEAVARGVEKRLKKIEDASDAGDWRASAWLLEHCQPEHFSKTRIQVEAVGQLEHSFVIPQQTLNEIAEARGRLEQKQNEQRQLEANGA